MRHDGIPRSLQDFIDDFDRRLSRLERAKVPRGVLLIENAATVPAETVVGTIIYEKGVGLRGWWDGDSVVSFT